MVTVIEMHAQLKGIWQGYGNIFVGCFINLQGYLISILTTCFSVNVYDSKLDFRFELRVFSLMVKIIYYLKCNLNYVNRIVVRFLPFFYKLKKKKSWILDLK